METRLTYPASLRLIRAARRDSSFVITRLDENPPWRTDVTSRRTVNDALLAKHGEQHGLRPDAKLTVLVPRDCDRSRDELRCHRICEKNLPSCSFVRISRPGDEPIVTESPELCVVRAAADLSLKVRQGSIDKDVALIRLVELIDELCGRYARHPSNPRSGQPAYELEPITSVERLSRYLNDARRIHGLTLFRMALPYALDNLGSPMETLLEMACCLSPHLGGLGLPKPVSNQPLKFSERERGLVSHVSLRPDLFWVLFHIAGEYNGHDHDGGDAGAEDDRRVSDYQACGIKVFPARFETVSTGKGLDGYLRKIVDAMAETNGRTWAHHALTVLDSSSYQRARQVLIDTMLPPRPADAIMTTDTL